MLEAKRAAVAEVQRAIAAAAAETRAAERLRVHHRFFEPQIQRSHSGHGGHSHGGLQGHQGPLLRVVETTTCSTTTGTTTAATTTATTTTTTSSSATGSGSRTTGGDDDKESVILSQPAAIQGSVSPKQHNNRVGGIFGYYGCTESFGDRNLQSCCWNCGRQALETCGGCGIARYCGSFCQHRDWEAGGHHATCNPRRTTPPPPPPLPPPPPPPSRSASRSPTTACSTGSTPVGVSGTGPSTTTGSTASGPTGKGK